MTPYILRDNLRIALAAAIREAHNKESAYVAGLKQVLAEIEAGATLLVVK